MAQDIVHAHRLHFRQYMRSRAGVTRLLLTCAIGTLAFFLVMAALSRPYDALVPTVIFALVVPFVTSVLLFAVNYATSGRLARRTLAQQKSLRGPIVVSWTDAGVTFTGDNGEARLKWTDFVKTSQDEHVFLLYESDWLYRMVPKRVLSADQIKRIDALTARL